DEFADPPAQFIGGEIRGVHVHRAVLDVEPLEKGPHPAEVGAKIPSEKHEGILPDRVGHMSAGDGIKITGKPEHDLTPRFQIVTPTSAAAATSAAASTDRACSRDRSSP